MTPGVRPEPGERMWHTDTGHYVTVVKAFRHAAIIELPPDEHQHARAGAAKTKRVRYAYLLPTCPTRVLACPCCGSASVEVGFGLSFFAIAQGARVSCRCCGLAMEKPLPRDFDGTDFERMRWAQAWALSDWNRREWRPPARAELPKSEPATPHP